MKSLRPVLDLIVYIWYRWARKDIHPLHEDVPEIMHKINELEARTPWLRTLL